MKVISILTDERVNEFLSNENVRVESITPVPNESNGIIWALTYEEKITVKKTVYRFGCGSYLSTIWDKTRYELTDDEFEEAKKAFIERELGDEPWRFRVETLGTNEYTEWR